MALRQTPSIPDGSRRPTTATRVPTRYVEPLALTDVKDAGLVPCVAPFCTLLVAAGGGALALSVGDTPELPQRSAAKAFATWLALISSMIGSPCNGLLRFD